MKDERPLIGDARLVGLYDYWLAKAGARAMPARGDIDPVEMKPWLGNLVLVEFLGGLENYRVRLEGVNIEAMYRGSRAGRGIEALTSKDERDLLLRQYGAVLENRRPAYYEADFQASEGVFARQNKLLLPLSNDGEHVNMILAGIYFR
jgi:hypothetical protein